LYRIERATVDLNYSLSHYQPVVVGVPEAAAVAVAQNDHTFSTTQSARQHILQLTGKR
jgi:hypothetical protein